MKNAHRTLSAEESERLGRVRGAKDAVCDQDKVSGRKRYWKGLTGRHEKSLRPEF